MTLASDIRGQATHFFSVILYFIVITKKWKKLSVSQSHVDLVGGVQANMLLLSQLLVIFAAFTVEQGTRERQTTHLKPLPTRQKLKDRTFCSVPTVPLSFRGMISY